MIVLPATGGCQCTQCRYTLSLPPFVSYTCHCLECQKLTGTAFLTCLQVPAEGLCIDSGSPICHKRVADTGNVLATWFCPTCGATLFAENSARPRIRTIHGGSLDNAATLEVDAHIWLKRKLPWVILPKGHRLFDESGDWRPDYADDLRRYLPE